MWKGKKKTLFPIAYFCYFEYAWVITIFYNGFNDWIIDVSEIGSQLACSTILRLIKILEKKVFRIGAV